MTQGYLDRQRGGFSLYGVLSVAFVLALSVQLIRSMVIDTYGIVGTRLDLLGYLICHAIGALLVLRAVQNRRLMPDVVALGILNIAYISVIVATTSLDTSLLALLVSRFGILNWFMLGLGAAAAASYIHLPVGTRLARTQRNMFLLAAAAIGLLLSLYSLTYLSYPVSTLSYQAVADSLIPLIIVMMIFTQVIWGGKVPLPVLTGLLVVGTLGVTAVARQQSTSIVGFWIVALLIYFWSALSKLSLKYKILAFATVVGGMTMYLSSELFTETLSETRFSEVSASGRLSSIDTRLSILADFGRQFAVSPIFGDFSAEIRANSGVGNYAHSLVSFLSHTGVVGTTLVCTLVYFIFSRRWPVQRLAAPDVQQFFFMGAVLALGLAYTFMTWQVLWFMLGFMCKTPTSRVPGAAR
jgi:hypothetical protein